jgi:trehalose 6-phosphate synthase
MTTSELQLVPGLLRRLRPDLRIGIYLTTTFPPGDLIRQLPDHDEIVAGLLGADIVGFACATAAENFLQLRRDSTASEAVRHTFRAARETNVGVYPQSIDTAAVMALAGQPAVAARSADFRSSLGLPATVLLSIDPPSDAVGVHARLRTLRALFADRVINPDEVAVIQVMTADEQPSTRDWISTIAREVAGINGQFATIGRPCVHFTHSSPSLAERVALYRAADAFVATPLRAGASLSALEFVAAARSGGALVLSEFSGTADVLPEAFLVNPYDRDEIRRALTTALNASPAERAQRLGTMRAYVRGYDAHVWARLILAALNNDWATEMVVDAADQLSGRR